MNNKIKQEMNKITIPNELSERSKMGVYQAKKEMKNEKKRTPIKSIGISAALLASVGAFLLFISNPFDNMKSDGSVTIPAIQLPKDTSNADMIALIVYNGKIYTQTNTEIDAEDAKPLVGEKLGTTKGTIDEWISQEAYDEELASTIGVSDVYSVNGYDKDFRIMTYKENNGEQYADLYENLNGITIRDGEDLFGQLKINNAVFAEYRVFSDWYYSIDNFYPIKELEVLNSFLNELNRAEPILPMRNPNSDERNDDNYRELTIHLEDGTRVKLALLKDGIISYGSLGVDFKVNQDVFSKLWKQLE